MHSLGTNGDGKVRREPANPVHLEKNYDDENAVSYSSYFAASNEDFGWYLSLSRIMQKLLDRFSQNSLVGWHVGHG